MSKKVILSGIQPSGHLCIGNYLGALKNWKALQNEYESIFLVVDMHALTVKQVPAELRQRCLSFVAQYIACGIDPNKSIIAIQSHIHEHAELMWVLNSICYLGELNRMTQFKDKSKNNKNINLGLYTYPVLMASDIILYKADTVPVGEDQVPHLELTREIVRRFNNMFGETFPEPKAKLTEIPLVLGLDGHQKMSKTLDNHVELATTEQETLDRIAPAYTDPQRLRRSDPGRPEMCNVYSLHKFFNKFDLPEIYDECTTAKRGCVDCKAHLGKGINRSLEPFRERRSEFEGKPNLVREILVEGANRASQIAGSTMDEVRERLGISGPQSFR